MRLGVPRITMARFRLERLRFRLVERGGGVFERGRGGLESFRVGVVVAQRRALDLELGKLQFETPPALRLLGEGRVERLLSRVKVRNIGLRLGERRLRRLQGLFGGEPSRLRLLARPVRVLQFLFDGARFVGEPLIDARCVARQRLFALQIERELFDAPLELRGARLGALLLTRQRIARKSQAMHGRAGARFGVSQARQRGGGDGREARRLGLGARALGDVAQIGFEPPRRLGIGGFHLPPGDEFCERVMAADFGGEGAVALRLFRLLFEVFPLRLDLFQHVFKADQIVFRRLQAQLRLVPARMQAGDAGRLFEDQTGAPAVSPR